MRATRTRKGVQFGRSGNGECQCSGEKHTGKVRFQIGITHPFSSFVGDGGLGIAPLKTGMGWAPACLFRAGGKRGLRNAKVRAKKKKEEKQKNNNKQITLTRSNYVKHHRSVHKESKPQSWKAENPVSKLSSAPCTSASRGGASLSLVAAHSDSRVVHPKAVACWPQSAARGQHAAGCKSMAFSRGKI